MSAPVLEVNGLKKSFGSLAAIDNVSLALGRGARHALIGPNGAGKTTLVGLLSGVLSPDAGRIALMGHDITRAAPQARVKRGLVRSFQVSSLFRGLTALENLYLAISEHMGASGGMLRTAASRRDILERAEMLLASMGLADDRHRKVAELAYGRQRLLEIAIPLALEPKVLLLDEPAAGIPAGEVDALLRAIAALPAEIAVLMIEHDMQIVRRFAAEVTVLVAGAVLMSGAPGEIVAAPAVREAYLGQSGYERFAARHA